MLDGPGSHRLHPKTFHWLFDVPDVEDVLKNELALPSGITSIHNEINILPPGLFEDVAESAFGLFNRLKLEGPWNGRQDVELPGKVFPVGPRWHLEFDQVPDRRGNDGLLIFEVARVERFPLLLELAEFLGEGAGEVGHDRGLLRDDEGFGHSVRAHTRRKAGLKRGNFSEFPFGHSGTALKKSFWGPFAAIESMGY